MKNVYTFLFAAMATTAAAQPTIDFGNFGTSVGESFLVSGGAWLDPGGAGADQTWDFSALVSDTTFTDTYVDPATTPEGASFPDATIALEWDGGFSYLQVAAAGSSHWGVAYPGQTPIVYDDPELVFAFPCTWNTTWTDPFSAEFVIAGFDAVRSGTANGLADGYGTLTLPWGTTTDVLRVQLIVDYTDVTPLATITYHDEFYYYLQANTHFPLLELYSNTVTFFGPPTTVTGANWLAEISTSVPASGMTSMDLSLRPNPATETITLTGDASVLNAMRSAELFDGSGRFVRSVGVMELANVNLATLDPGLYVLRVTDAQGTARFPFIKQ